MNGDEPDVPPDLDQELRRLFADDRLTLPVGRNTEARVIAGADRRRRRRRRMAATSGVIAIAAVILAGAGLSGLVHPTHQVRTATGPPVLSTTVVPTTVPPAVAPASNTAEDAIEVLGPDGIGTLDLGMSWQAALATGLLRESGPVTSAGCVRYNVLIGPLIDGTPSPTGQTKPAVPPVREWVAVVVSVRDGVVQVIEGPMLRTPEGVGVGSSRDDLRDAYPDVDVPKYGGSTYVPATGNPLAEYVFTLSGTGTVTSFSLRMAKSDCLG